MDITNMNAAMIEAQVIEALRTCFDPEIPVNIYELGLIYGIQVDPTGAVAVAAGWALGARADCTSRFFAGDLDEVRVYNRGLAPADVAYLASLP